MALPDKVTQAETLQNNVRLHEQKGGSIFRNGAQFDYPAGYPTGPAGMQPARPAEDESAKLSTHVDPEDKK